MVSEKDSGREISRETRMTAAIIARFMGFRILRMLSLGEKSVLSPLLALMFAGSSGAGADFTVVQVCLYSFHGWALLAVMLFAILTGWGRKDGKGNKKK